MNSLQNLWGICLVGNEIEGAILTSGDVPEVLFRRRVPAEANKGYEHLLRQVKKLVDAMESEVSYRPERLGVGTPGALIPSTGFSKNGYAAYLKSKPLKKDLEELLEIQIAMTNDANCFALAETKMGVVKEKFPEAKVVFGAILGTGVGGGIVINGQVTDGYRSIGGEWGHDYLNKVDGKQCYCGRVGCNESILSVPALEGYYFEISGNQRKLSEIIALAREQSDIVATYTLRRLINYFGVALSVVVNILNPDVVVVGGEFGNIDEIYEEGVVSLKNYVLIHDYNGPVVKHSLGDSAVAFGAAFLTSSSTPGELAT